MDKKTIGKFLMMGLGTAMALGASFIQSKNQEREMKETVVKEVAEYFKNQAKES